MKFRAEVKGIEQVQRYLAIVGRVGSDPIWRELWHELAAYGLSTVKRQFAANAGGTRKGRGVVWPELHWMDRVTRPRAAGGKIRTIDEAKAIPANPLLKSGELRRSWDAGQNMVSDLTHSEVGTHLPYAEIHQEGGTQVWRFDADKQQAFEGNVEKGAEGSWNKEYFIMRALLRKRDKRMLKIRQRPMVPPNFPSPGDRGRIIGIVHSWFERVMGESQK
jgi:phage gpG-like protein